ncbi:helix-turn-helix transcriptional regulator [Streptomyces sp. AP-93]|uniref:helix-turn-helix domain-containing protein n=1 Tax=Streptomyces sp. AP-93 TaxID=2929048 RepID=UPI001FAFB052|nr:helix-turn-helix transcriptional regulator [Streptomyces sp. AP-93]MCJ0868687.1 helix-turn-helix domain-containing protein [Streptomyces sp. AP-93]
MAAKAFGIVHAVGSSAPAPVAGASAQVPRQLLGAALRTHRKAAGWTLVQVAAHGVVSSPSVLSRIENGMDNAAISRERVERLLDFYQVRDRVLRDAAVRHLEETLNGRQRWWSDYRDVVDQTLGDLLNVESTAREITSFEAVHIPGLLQIPSYAEAVMKVPYLGGEVDAAKVKRRMDVRRRRQQVLDEDDVPEYSAIIDESVLRRWVGDKTVMREQLRKLYSFAENRSRVHIRILPARNWKDASPVTTSMSLFKFPDGAGDDMVYAEASNLGARWLKAEEIDLHRASLEQVMKYSLGKAESLAFLQLLIDQLLIDECAD